MPPRARPRPKHLPAKLRAIRETYKLTVSQTAQLVGVTAARIYEYETGQREPNLLILLAYSQMACVHLELIVNDRVNLASFRDVLISKSSSLR